MNEKIEELLVDWEIARQENRILTPQELCVDCPELLDEFRKELERLNETSWLFEKTRAAFVEPKMARKTQQEFFTGLAESRLLSDNDLAEVVESKVTSDVSESAESLVKRNKLSRYQANVLLGLQRGPLRLDRYEIRDELGVGGMGEVYKGWHTSMKRDVAIKILASHSRFSNQRRERFIREIQAIARLNHPNIVTAYDANESDGTFYLVMEYVNGPNLADLVRESGPLELEEATKIARQIAEAAQFAHDHGIVHRDIKPANILYSNNKIAKLLDLGIAKTRSQPESGQDESQLTQTNGLFGTVAYMSPEHATDPREIDCRTDIYSLGCTLLFLLTGSPPFENENPIRVVLSHREDSVEPILDDRNVPQQIRPLLVKMLAKNVDERFQTMTEVSSALLSTGDNAELNVLSSKHSSKAWQVGWKKWLVAAAVLVAIVGGGYGIYSLTKSTANESIPEFESESYQNDLARWITNNGGTVVANTEIDVQELVSSDEVPAGPIQITAIELNGLTDDFSFDWLVRIDTLESLRITNSVLMEEDVFHFGKLAQLKELLIFDCEVVPEIWQAVGELSELSNLQIDFVDDSWKAVESIGKLNKLTSLGLSGCELTDELAAKLLARFELRNVDFSDTRVTSKTLHLSLMEAGLQTLDFGYTEIEDDSFDGLPVNRTLKRLGLDYCNVGMEMANFASKLPSLKELYVEGTEIGNEEFLQLKNCRNLEHLDVSNTENTRQALGQLKLFPKLNSLSLAGVELTNTDIKELKSVGLEYLDLSDTPIREPSLRVLEGFAELETLVIVNCELSESALKEFALSVPHCDVFVEAEGYKSSDAE
jgi:serine/threonine protein kinase/Leucine-rich repeat (LRR) protein